MSLAIFILALILVLAVLVDYFTFRHERLKARRQRQEWRKWWNEREHGPEGDH